jgi:hypothetical protein
MIEVYEHAKPELEARTLGWSELAKRTGFRYGTFQKVIDYYVANGKAPDPKPRGRKRIIGDGRIIDTVELAVEEIPTISSADLKQRVRLECGVNISRKSADCIRHDLRYRFKPPRHMPRLSKSQMKVRYQFAYDERQLDPQGNVMLLEQYQIVFSDESRFCMDSDGHWVWRRKGETNPKIFVETEKFEISIMVWGAIGHGFKSRLIFVDGNEDSDEYLRVLDEAEVADECDSLFGIFNWRFQQDGAPCHTSGKTMASLRQRMRLLPGWPPNRPRPQPD